MMNAEAKRLIEGVVADLCEKCDADCPIFRGVNMGIKLPDCYKGDGGRAKIEKLMTRVVDKNPDLAENDAIAVNRVFEALIHQ